MIDLMTVANSLNEQATTFTRLKDTIRPHEARFKALSQINTHNITLKEFTEKARLQQFIEFKTNQLQKLYQSIKELFNIEKLTESIGAYIIEELENNDPLQGMFKELLNDSDNPELYTDYETRLNELVTDCLKNIRENLNPTLAILDEYTQRSFETQLKKNIPVGITEIKLKAYKEYVHDSEVAGNPSHATRKRIKYMP